LWASFYFFLGPMGLCSEGRREQASHGTACVVFCQSCFPELDVSRHQISQLQTYMVGSARTHARSNNIVLCTVCCIGRPLAKSAIPPPPRGLGSQKQKWPGQPKAKGAWAPKSKNRSRSAGFHIENSQLWNDKSCTDYFGFTTFFNPMT
jgi:hypothetical protein